MSAQPLPTKLADLSPSQLHSLQDYVEAERERAKQLGFPSNLTPGQALRSKAFRETYEVITTTPGRHQRGQHKAGSPLAIALERMGYRPVYADWDVGETPDAEDEGAA